ncbi:hypothetical protein ACTHSJ_19050 [Paenibacillus cellulositrophicus]|uniref:hypothetical protein n=1 Tax=Paenibacillus cellulositrophicus TaxID=562959 RepID=UPI003F7E5C27
MYPISPLYADYLKGHDREFIIKAIINGEEYTSAAIVEFSIENSLTLSEGFEIGTAIPNKLTIKLRVKTEIPANARIVPYLAISTEGLSWDQAIYPWQEMNIPWTGGSTEWLPLGEFFVDSREKINDVWTFTCYDKLVTADVPYISQLSYPATQKAIWDEICGRLGFTYDGSVVINPTYQIQAGPAGYSCRQVLAYIAGANGASVFVGKDGVLRFKRFAAGAPAVFEMTTSDYIRVKQTNPVKSYSRVVVTYNTEDSLTYEAGSGDDNHTLKLENPFMTQTMVNNLQAQLNGFSYLPMTMEARGFPHLDQGDIIGYAQNEGSSWLETITTWESTDIPWDGIRRYSSLILHQVLSFKGGLKLSIDAPSISEQKSEFVVEGSLSQQVNKLNQDAVRYGKPYYGITHSRTEGFVVEREDHLSRLQLNSDVMDWKVDGTSVLYLDALARRLKFAGTLEGVDGTFSGTIQGGSFVGGSIRIGSGFSVDSSGHMAAAGADFSGTISASVITGGQINGTTISGSTIIGSVLKTAQSGRRIEIDVEGLHSYGSSGQERISISTNDSYDMGAINFPGVGRLWGSSSLLQLLATTTMQIVSTSSGGINFQGGVDFSNSTISGISISKVDGLSSRLNSIDSDISYLEISVGNKANVSEAGYNLAFDSTSRNLKLYSKTGVLLAQVNIP